MLIKWQKNPKTNPKHFYFLLESELCNFCYNAYNEGLESVLFFSPECFYWNTFPNFATRCILVLGLTDPNSSLQTQGHRVTSQHLVMLMWWLQDGHIPHSSPSKKQKTVQFHLEVPLWWPVSPLALQAVDTPHLVENRGRSFAPQTTSSTCSGSSLPAASTFAHFHPGHYGHSYAKRARVHVQPAGGPAFPRPL